MDVFSPGQVDALTLIYGTTGRAAHLTVQVAALADESLYYGPLGTNIEEDESGVYDIDAFAYPSIAGTYRTSWYDDGVLIPGAVDEFRVSTSASGITIAPAGSDLTTLARVKDWLGL